MVKMGRPRPHNRCFPDYTKSAGRRFATGIERPERRLEGWPDETREAIG